MTPARRRRFALTFALTLPPGFAQTEFTTGLDRPTAMAFAPDGRLFVTEQGGALRVVKDGELLDPPFLTLPALAHRERGLLAVEFDPDFAANRFVYVYYTAAKPWPHNRLSRFRAKGDLAAKGSEVVLLDLPELGGEFHNGGGLHFGPDGKLYLSVGENAQREQAQSLDTVLGKVLRLERDGSFPEDNPFATGAAPGAARRAIYAYGLRNPFTFAFDPEDGRLLINDVGKRHWEEINAGRPGANYGWPLSEGPTHDPRFDAPFVAYKHGRSDDTGCAVTGAVFYPPANGAAAFPTEHRGDYFFSDFCGGWVRRIARGERASRPFLAGGSPAIDLDVGPDGALYMLDYEHGVVRRAAYTGSKAPQIAEPPRDLVLVPGEAGELAVVATGIAPLTYQWWRDGAAIPGASASRLTLAPVQAIDDGARFEVVVGNAFGSTRSPAAVLRVVAGTRPVVEILEPASGSTYAGGDVVRFAAAATDADDGPLPPAALDWRVDFHHGTHFHPFIAPSTGSASGEFLVPTTGETATDVWYRFVVTARDTAGLEATATRDLTPRLSSFSVATEPPGLAVTIDGEPRPTPAEETGVVGVTRSLGVFSPQQLEGTFYEFAEWSDGGAAGHAISTPAEPALFLARFRPAPNGLRAAYYGDPDFTVLALERLERRIDFDWALGGPHPGIKPDTWSARFAGALVPEVTGPHTLYLRSDGGARLFLDEALVIDHWTPHGTGLRSAVVELAAASPYRLRIEFYDDQGPALLRFLWLPPGADRRSVVPHRVLRPDGS